MVYVKSTITLNKSPKILKDTLQKSKLNHEDKANFELEIKEIKKSKNNEFLFK